MFENTDKQVAHPLGVAAWVLPLIFVMIVASLAVGVAMSFHDAHKTLSQEARSAQWVGEKEPPKAAIKITVKPSSRSCLHIEQASFDDGRLTVYVRRLCGRGGDYGEAHWKALAADRTIIGNGYTNWEVMNADLNERAEWVVGQYAGVDEPRTVEIVLWTEDR